MRIISCDNEVTSCVVPTATQAGTNFLVRVKHYLGTKASTQHGECCAQLCQGTCCPSLRTCAECISTQRGRYLGMRSKAVWDEMDMCTE